MDENEAGGRTAPYSRFMIRHPEYTAEYWAKVESLYRGGDFLLGNEKLMRKLFPKHRGEHDSIYKERCARAYYIPWAGEIVDQTVSGVCEDPIIVEIEGKETLDEEYSEFIADTSRPSKRTKCSLDSFLSDRILQALIKRRSWAQIDMPVGNDDVDDAAEEKKLGLGRNYLIPLDAESVIDWEFDDDDELIWAMTMTESSRRESPTHSRNKTTKTFMSFDRDSWEKWEITHDTGEEPSEKARVTMVDEGSHSYTCVPLICLEFPYGLWSMGKIEPIARTLLNDLNSLAWAVVQSLMQELYEFLGSEDTGPVEVGEAQRDKNRGVNQRRGVGFVQVRGADDSAAYVGPPTEGFEFAQKRIESHRDEMHRVNLQTGINSDVNAATIRRSAESKQEDSASSEVMYRAIGRIVREYVDNMMRVIAISKGASPDNLPTFKSTGMAKFTQKSSKDHIDRALIVDQISILSPTFKRLMQLDVAKTHLDDLDEETLATIAAEIEENITDDHFSMSLTQDDMDAMNESQPGQKDDDDDGEYIGQ